MSVYKRPGQSVYSYDFVYRRQRFSGSTGCTTERETEKVEVAADAPLTLKEACSIFFRGRITPATLRAEARRGRLVIMRIGRADFVTPSAMREMMKRCQTRPEASSIPTLKGGVVLSESDRPQSALAAARAIANELKKQRSK